MVLEAPLCLTHVPAAAAVLSHVCGWQTMLHPDAVSPATSVVTSLLQGHSFLSRMGWHSCGCKRRTVTAAVKHSFGPVPPTSCCLCAAVPHQGRGAKATHQLQCQEARLHWFGPALELHASWSSITDAQLPLNQLEQGSAQAQAPGWVQLSGSWECCAARLLCCCHWLAAGPWTHDLHLIAAAG